MNICRLTEALKCVWARVPLATRVHRLAHFPNPTLFSNVYCPVATLFLNPSLIKKRTRELDESKRSGKEK